MGASGDRKTQRMSAEQFKMLLREGGAEPVRVTTVARLVPRATTVEDPETTAELAALTAPPPPAAPQIKHAFDTSDEPEDSGPRAREPLATVEMTPEMIVREPRGGRAPLATMELSSDMILQIAVNAPLAVARPPMATMELTPDMILPEGMARAKSSAAPPAAPAPAAAPAVAPEPALPTVIVDQRRLHREEIEALDKPPPVAEPAPVPDIRLLAAIGGLALAIIALLLLLLFV